MATKNTRKCKICGNEFNIFENDYVHFKGGFVEVDCYRQYKKEKGNTDEVIELQLDELLKVSKEESRLRVEKEIEDLKKKSQAKKKEINRKENLDKLIKYFSEIYEITMFPRFTYTKLAQINNGTFRGITNGIPYSDLLDMFKRKQNYLDKVAFNNFRQGKEIVGIQRLNYDLAIIINKYDEYLSWKNKQKILSMNTTKAKEDENNKIQIDYKKIKVEENNDDMGIFDIVNDIY